MRAYWPSLLAAALFALAPAEAADWTVQPVVSRIPRQPVESTALAAVGYSSRLRVLEIEFRHGRVYRYVDVPRSVYRDLMTADSKARFYIKNVRGKYRCLRVKPARGR